MKKAALVLDDGPHETQREKWLSLLKSLNVKVTFACLGRQIEAYPELALAAENTECEQVNHSFSHAHCTQISEDELRDELQKTSDLFRQTVGKPSPWFWAPYGEFDDAVNSVVESLGMRNYRTLPLHFVSSGDCFLENSAESIFEQATTGIEDRTVIICHEWREETFDLFPKILAELKSQGVELVTFSELAGETA